MKTILTIFLLLVGMGCAPNSKSSPSPPFANESDYGTKSQVNAESCTNLESDFETAAEFLEVEGIGNILIRHGNVFLLDIRNQPQPYLNETSLNLRYCNLILQNAEIIQVEPTP